MLGRTTLEMSEAVKHWLKACFIGSLVSGFALSMAGFTGDLNTPVELILSTLSVAVYGFSVALLISAIYELPIYLTLRKLGALSFGPALVAGALPGVIWIVVTNGGWIDPILWHGVVIAGFFYVFDKKDESPNKAL